MNKQWNNPLLGWTSLYRLPTVIIAFPCSSCHFHEILMATCRNPVDFFITIVSFETGIKLEKKAFIFLFFPLPFKPNNIVFLFCCQPVTSSDIQIFMHPPNSKGVMLECHSAGWFPLPHMEWRDSKGEVIPEISKSHSQDINKLFNMTMVLLIKASSHRNVTCCLRNLLTHQEESISIILSGKICLCSSVTAIISHTYY